MLEQMLYDTFITEWRASEINQLELCKRTGYTAKHVNQLINRRISMNCEAADRLLRALGREWVIGTTLLAKSAHEGRKIDPGRKAY